MAPNITEKIRRVIGSSRGSNHIGFMVTSCPRKVLENTDTASPNQPPNIAPQMNVDTPPQNRRFTIFFIVPSSLNFFIIAKQAAARIIPYAASESISPKNMK